MAPYFGLRGSSLRKLLFAGVVAPAFLNFGYNNSVGGGLLDLPAWIEVFPQIDTVNTTGAQKTQNSRVQGTVIALYTLGCLFGALSCIYIGDRLGRIRTMLLGATIQIIGAIIQSTSYGLPQLIVGRLVSGLGLGAVSATVPTWQSECSGAQHRGATVLLEGVFLSGGLATGAWVNVGISHATGPVTWRFPLALATFWSLWLISMAWKLPESPRWLMKKGRVDEAREVLAALNDITPDSEEVNVITQDIQASLNITGQGRFTDLFHNGPERYFHRTCLAAAGQLCQQMCGVNSLAFYQTTIFHEYLGVNAPDARIISAGVFTWQTLCAPVGVVTVDRYGRRKLLMFAALGMGVCMSVVAGTAPHPDSRPAIIVAGTFIYIFSFFLSIGYLGLTFLYATEVAPLSVRMPITAISTGTAWLFNFVIAEITPVAFANIGARYYIVFVCINFGFIFPLTYFFFPETTGRSLEEVDEIFLQSTSIFDTVKISLELPRQNLVKFGVAVDNNRKGEKSNKGHMDGGSAGDSSQLIGGDGKFGVRTVENVESKA